MAALVVTIALFGAATIGVSRLLLRPPQSGPSFRAGGPTPGRTVMGETAPASAGGRVVTGTAAPSGSEVPAVAGSGSPDRVGPTGAALDDEVARALVKIAEARVQAFEMVSPRRLALADEPGSAADTADEGLLRRLHERGYRLEALGYRISAVKVLEATGGTVRVRALVSMSAHRQVRVSGDSEQGVPGTQPSPMLFTLAATGAPTAGADRWRVRDIRNGT